MRAFDLNDVKMHTREHAHTDTHTHSLSLSCMHTFLHACTYAHANTHNHTRGHTPPRSMLTHDGMMGTRGRALARGIASGSRSDFDHSRSTFGAFINVALFLCALRTGVPQHGDALCTVCPSKSTRVMYFVTQYCVHSNFDHCR